MQSFVPVDRRNPAARLLQFLLVLARIALLPALLVVALPAVLFVLPPLLFVTIYCIQVAFQRLYFPITFPSLCLFTLIWGYVLGARILSRRCRCHLF